MGGWIAGGEQLQKQGHAVLALDVFRFVRQLPDLQARSDASASLSTGSVQRDPIRKIDEPQHVR